MRGRAFVLALVALAGCAGGGARGDGGPADARGAETTEAPPLGACLGVCLETFLAPCPKVLGCVSSTGGGVTNVCYANGVKEQRVASSMVDTGAVKKADGALCYRWRRPSASQDYLDVDANVAAHYEQEATPTLFLVSCGPDGVVTEGDYRSPECATTYAIDNQVCETGACVF